MNLMSYSAEHYSLSSSMFVLFSADNEKRTRMKCMKPHILHYNANKFLEWNVR